MMSDHPEHEEHQGQHTHDNAAICIICLAPRRATTASCPQCNASFCCDCLVAWFSKKGGNPECPQCRLQSSAEDFMGNAHRTCSFCNDEIHPNNYVEHVSACQFQEAECPFAGCSFRSARHELDVHVVACPYSTAYSSASVVDFIVERTTKENMTIAYPSLARQPEKQPETIDGKETIVHYVEPHDTLSGLAIRYSTTAQEILKLNRITAAGNIHARSTIVIPKPKGWQPPKRQQLSPEVLLALRKKQLIKVFMHRCKTSKQDATAYLHLAAFDLGTAVERHKADTMWALQHRSKQPSSLAGFLERLQGGMGACPCGDRLGARRDHCRSCGTIVCHTCCDKGALRYTVPKRLLGVTCPVTQDEHVQVCWPCYTSVGTSQRSYQDTACRSAIDEATRCSRNALFL